MDEQNSEPATWTNPPPPPPSGMQMLLYRPPFSATGCAGRWNFLAVASLPAIYKIYLHVLNWYSDVANYKTAKIAHFTRSDINSACPIMDFFSFFLPFSTQIRNTQRQAPLDAISSSYHLLHPEEVKLQPCSRFPSCLSVEPSVESRPPQWEPLKQKSLRL